MCFVLHNSSVTIFLKHFSGFDMLHSSTYQVVVLIIVISASVGEIVCYGLFFHHAFRHDNGNIKKILDPQVIRRRNRKNLTSFLAQFYAFATECGFLVIFLIILASDSTNTSTKAMALVIKYMEFGGLSLVEIIASEEMRKMMSEDFRKVKSVLTLC